MRKCERHCEEYADETQPKALTTKGNLKAIHHFGKVVWRFKITRACKKKPKQPEAWA
jgi:hypothetical protein